jgi:hypothetical protein
MRYSDRPDPYEELHKAWIKLITTFAEEFYIIKFMDWLVIKLENGAKRWKIVRMLIR